MGFRRVELVREIEVKWCGELVDFRAETCTPKTMVDSWREGPLAYTARCLRLTRVVRDRRLDWNFPRIVILSALIHVFLAAASLMTPFSVGLGYGKLHRRGPHLIEPLMLRSPPARLGAFLDSGKRLGFRPEQKDQIAFPRTRGRASKADARVTDRSAALKSGLLALVREAWGSASARCLGAEDWGPGSVSR